MTRTYKITRFLRTNLLACVALFVALGGSAYAADTVFSSDIVDGEVQSVDVQDEGLTGTDIRALTGADIDNGSLNGADVGNDSLTGADVSGLGTADVNDNSLTGADISGLTGSDIDNDSLTGSDISESSLSVDAMGCKDGLVKGYARIHGTAGIPTSFVDEPVYVDETQNCSGSDVDVRRESEGVYFVRFNGNGADLAVAVPNQDGATTQLSGDADNTLTVGKITSGPDAGSFRVDVHDEPDSVRQNGAFTIMLM